MQRRQHLEGVLGLHHEQPVERARRHLAGETSHGFGAPVAGEQQQPEAGGFHRVDDALQHLAHPRPGQRGHQHAHRPAAAPGQPDGTRTGYIAHAVDDLADTGSGRCLDLATGVQHPRHGRLAHAGRLGHIGDGHGHNCLPAHGDRGFTRRRRNRYRERYRNRFRRWAGSQPDWHGAVNTSRRDCLGRTSTPAFPSERERTRRRLPCRRGVSPYPHLRSAEPPPPGRARGASPHGPPNRSAAPPPSAGRGDRRPSAGPAPPATAVPARRCPSRRAV